MPRTLAPLAVALLLILAGCAGPTTEPERPSGALPVLYVPLELTASEGFRPSRLLLERGADRELVIAVTQGPASEHFLLLQDSAGQQVALLGAANNYDPEFPSVQPLPLWALDGRTRLSDGLPAGVYTLVDLKSEQTMELTLE